MPATGERTPLVTETVVRDKVSGRPPQSDRRLIKPRWEDALTPGANRRAGDRHPDEKARCRPQERTRKARADPPGRRPRTAGLETST